MKTKRQKFLNLILPIVTLLSIVLLWTIASLSVNSKYVLPSVPETLKELTALLGEAKFYVAFFYTFSRSLIAFLLSFVIAFVLAILSERSFIAKKIISPIISIIRALPTIAVVLLLLFWTNSFVAPIIVTMLVVLPTLYVNLTSAISSVDKNLLEMCYFYNVEKKQVLKKVIVPCILPQTLTAMGAGISLNLKLMVAAEVLASTAKSIGGLLNYTNSNLQTAKMIALVVITVILALIIEKIFSFFSLKVGKWQ